MPSGREHSLLRQWQVLRPRYRRHHRLSALPYMPVMEADSLKRRLRFAEPQTKDQRIQLHEEDIAVFSALQRHGPLPTTYLHEFAGRANTNKNASPFRLTKLYNGAAQVAPSLFRPSQQFRSFNARYHHLIYDLKHRPTRDFGGSRN